MKLAIRESMAPGETLADKLAWIEQAGLQGIELHAGSLALPPDEVRATLANSPVRAASIDSGLGLVDPSPAARQEARERIRARLDLAGSLAATGVLVVPQFARQPGLPDLSPVATAQDLERALVDSALRDLLPTARASGSTLFLEPLNRYESWMINRLEQGVALADEVGPEIGVMADLFHMDIEEADLAAAIRSAGNRVVHVHLADSNRLQPGRGHLDFGSAFAALKAINYDGWFGIECRMDGPIDEVLPESVSFIRETWQAA